MHWRRQCARQPIRAHNLSNGPISQKQNAVALGFWGLGLKGFQLRAGMVSTLCQIYGESHVSLFDMDCSLR